MNKCLKHLRFNVIINRKKLKRPAKIIFTMEKLPYILYSTNIYKRILY